ncbi:MAG: PLAT/LH2 domain-containing protein [Bacteroidales bacterium]
MKERKFNYLLVLQHPSADSAKNACALAQSLNVCVTSQIDDRAIEIFATQPQAERLFAQGLFSHYTRRGFAAEHIKDFDPELISIAQTWNTKFSASYLKLKKDYSKQGLKWQNKDSKEPLPYSIVEPHMLLEEIRRQKKINEKKLKPCIKIEVDKVGVKEIEVIREFFNKTLKDEYWADQILGVFYRSSNDFRPYFLDPDALLLILDIVRDLQLANEPTCLKMSGRNSVGIVFVESSQRNGPTFSNADKATIENEIRSGLSFLAGEHPAGNLVWVYNVQHVKIDVANKPNIDSGNSSYDTYWRFPAIGAVSFQGHTFTANEAGVDDYRDAMRAHHDTQHATVIFVSAFGMYWAAYSSGRRFIAMGPHGDNWAHWGINNVNAIAAHETCHQFGATDEYVGSGTPCNSCGGVYGCKRIPNGNCGTCAAPQERCLMDGNDLHLCQYTKGQIGWCDIFVELWTDDSAYSGTDDNVRLDIGYRTFNLDTAHNDRERGNREGYALWAGGNLSRDSIKRILIRKSSDGAAGGWKLKRIKVYHDGEIICDQTPHVWLQDRKCWYLACTFDNTLVNTLNLTVATADVAWAGTDDDVTLRLAGRSWEVDSDANDFERNSTRSYELDPQTSFRVSDIHSITIHKSRDGAAGGWKLKGLKLKVNGNTIYDNQSINQWLEDNDRTFSDEI